MFRIHGSAYLRLYQGEIPRQVASQKMACMICVCDQLSTTVQINRLLMFYTQNTHYKMFESNTYFKEWIDVYTS